jgi:hypothetical protein
MALEIKLRKWEGVDFGTTIGDTLGEVMNLSIEYSPEQTHFENKQHHFNEHQDEI